MLFLSRHFNVLISMLLSYFGSKTPHIDDPPLFLVYSAIGISLTCELNLLSPEYSVIRISTHVDPPLVSLLYKAKCTSFSD